MTSSGDMVKNRAYGREKDSIYPSHVLSLAPLLKVTGDHSPASTSYKLFQLFSVNRQKTLLVILDLSESVVPTGRCTIRSHVDIAKGVIRKSSK